MSMRRSGEHQGHSYRCWVEPGPQGYRGWHRGKLEIEVGDKNFVDRLHGSTSWHSDAEEALDEAETRVKAAIEAAVEAS